jgi:MFS family permease
MRGVVEQPCRASFAEVRAVLRKSPAAVVGITAIAIGHAVMVMVMVMTPVHMHHVEVTLSVIGLVISVHIVGMYAFSPLVGWLADRFDPRPCIGVGVLLLAVATLLAGTAPGDDIPRLGVGLLLLGLGWSFTLVAGSALVTESVEDADRPSVQGFGDTVMNGAGALGGVLAGVIVVVASYAWLNFAAVLCLFPLLLLLLREDARTAR